MKTPKFSQDKKEISDQEIEQYENFDQLLQQFTTAPKPFYKGGKFWIGLSSATILITLTTIITLNVFNDNKVELPTNILDSSQATTCFIQPPFAEFNTPYEYFTIDNTKDTILHTASGSVIKIPSNTFENNDVFNPVTIQYREFKNPYDFFVAGIPMKYDSAGNEFHLESAGMLEIIGFVKNKPAKIADGKAIQVQMTSPTHDENFNQYYLDTIDRNWKYISRDKVNTPDTQTSKKSITPPVQVAEKENILYAPQLRNKKRYVFNANVNLAAFPELAQYKNILFEVNTSLQTFDPKLYKVTWLKSKLQKYSDNKHYILTLSRPDTSINLIVQPVFDTENYEAALKIYTTNENKLSEKRAADERKSIEIKTTTSSSSVFEYDFTRTLNVTDFGYWNCDRPKVLPNSVVPIITNSKTKNKLDYNGINVVCLPTNALFRFGGNNLQYTKRGKTLVWVVTNDNQIAIITPEEFEATIAANKKIFNATVFNLQDGLVILKNYLNT